VDWDRHGDLRGDVRLTAFVAEGDFRGGLEVGSVMYAAFEDELFTVTAEGELKYFDDLAGTDRAHFARNQNTTPDVVIVCDDGAYQISGTSVIAYSDADVGSPRGVTYHDGWFFFWYEDADILASALNSTSINTLDAANAASNADGLQQCWPYNGQLYAGGEKTIEIWGYPVNNAGFPLNRVGYHITPGVMNEHACAGFAPEWGMPPIYVGSDNTVRWLKEGYQPSQISTPDLERLLTAVEDKTTIQTMAYRVAGTAFWEVSADDWTWVFNATHPGWFERQSDGQTRSRFTGGAVYAFGRWFTGDNTQSVLLEVTSAVQTEDDDPLPVTMISPSMRAFPNRVRVARADFDFVVPAVTAETTAPTVDISWSDDGGASFGNAYTRSLGNSTADTIRRVTVLNTGYSKPIGRRWKLECSDPVDFALLGASMETEIRRK
jgi:hypothetical protein